MSNVVTADRGARSRIAHNGKLVDNTGKDAPTDKSAPGLPPQAEPSQPEPSRSDQPLALDALSLTRRGMCLLDEISLTVEPGQTLAVMGPSGAGKSTLLKTIAGLAEPDAGSITRPAGRVAMVFQDPRLLPWRSTLANVEVVLPKHQRARARTWLEEVGLGDATDVYPSALSGGMRQRVAIARALACDASVLLIDEPFASLDDHTAQRLRELLVTELRSLGRPAVWVTHNSTEAQAVASRTLVMDGPPQGSWRIISN